MKKIFDIDFIGMAASVLCLIHCLALPWLVAFAGSFLGSYVESPSFHNFMLVLAIAIGLPIFVVSFMKYKSKIILFTGVAGLSLTTFGTMQEDSCCPPVKTEISCESSCEDQCAVSEIDDEEATNLSLQDNTLLQGFNTIPLGVSFLLLAHFLNFRKKRSCKHACCD